MFLSTKRKTEVLGPLKQVFRKIGIQGFFLGLNVLKSLLDSEVKVPHMAVITLSTPYCSLDHYYKNKVPETLAESHYLHSSKLKE